MFSLIQHVYIFEPQQDYEKSVVEHRSARLSLSLLLGQAQLQSIEHAVTIFGSVIYGDPSISAAFLAHKPAHYSQLTFLAIYAVMSDHEEADVARAIKAVRSAYDDLQALRRSRPSMIPLSLEVAGMALDKLSYNLNLVAGSAEISSSFYASTMRRSSVSTGVLLPDALVQDMEAIAQHFQHMVPTDATEIMSDLDEQQCIDIADMVDFYDRAIYFMLITPKRYA
jgi:hypothetical protein